MYSISEDSLTDCESIIEVKTPEKRQIQDEIIEVIDSPIKTNLNHLQNKTSIETNHTRPVSSFRAFAKKYAFNFQTSITNTSQETFSSISQQNSCSNSEFSNARSNLNIEDTNVNNAFASIQVDSIDDPLKVDSRPIGGIMVDFPVKPYGVQVALMGRVIKGINLSQNCLLESPTGSGKTLALLCASLAWQKHEKERVRKLIEEDYNDFPGHNSPQKFPKNLQCDHNSPSKPSTSSNTSKVKRVYKSIYFDECDGDSEQRAGKWEKADNTSDQKNLPVGKKKNKKCVYYDSDDDSDLFKQKIGKSGNDYSTQPGGPDDECQKGGDQCQRATVKRQELSPDSGYPSSHDSEFVTIHKRHKMSASPGAFKYENSAHLSPAKGSSPLKSTTCEEKPNIGLFNTEDGRNQQNRYKVPKIYFGTRTHKQLEQVVKELRRTTYSRHVKMSILSSREHTCIRNHTGSYKSKTEQCKALMDKTKNKHQREGTSGCRFYDNKIKLIGKNAPQGVWDIEDIVELGRKRDACPYFAARDLADFADIVFCPYNYLLDPLIRNSIKLSLDGHIVLIDEGHNIEDVCRDTASLTVEITSVDLALQDLQNILERKPLHSDDDSTIFYYFKKYFTNWSDWFQNHKPLLLKQSNSESSYSMDGSEFADSLRRHDIGYNTFDDLKIRVNKVLLDLQESKEDNDKKRYLSGATVVLLESICLILDYLFRNNCGNLDDYKGILTKRIDWEYQRPQTTGWLGKNVKRNQEENVKMTLKVCCMNSALVFDGVSQKSRCVILASGTLTPTLSFPAELGTTFPLTLHTAHVISPSQVWVGSVNSGPNGVPLEGTFRNTSRPEWQDALGELLVWVCQNVPHGILCFLSSYRLMEVLQERWQSTGLWRRLEQQKAIFTESRKMSEHDQVMTDFYSCVGEGGAILFAVFRGKVSEGMDFRDHQARAVVTVGIPYPNVKDVIIEGKMKYNESHKVDRSLVSGRDWLQIQAYRALNQALGRCIRHKNDWGAVIMVDSRFQAPSYTLHISKWVRSFLGDNHHSWESLIRGPNSLVKFMNNMKLSQPDTTQNC